MEGVMVATCWTAFIAPLLPIEKTIHAEFVDTTSSTFVPVPVFDLMLAFVAVSEPTAMVNSWVDWAMV
jgi:hypothetical protein